MNDPTEPCLSAVLLDRSSAVEAVCELFTQARVAVRGTATSEEVVLELVARHDPDLLIFDPDACASAPELFLQAVAQKNPKITTLAVSEKSDPDTIDAGLHAGASAYMLKAIGPDELAVAVRRVYSQTNQSSPQAARVSKSLSAA
jgi:DNA-binding NarL/FixJ family response regulator